MSHFKRGRVEDVFDVHFHDEIPSNSQGASGDGALPYGSRNTMSIHRDTSASAINTIRHMPSRMMVDVEHFGYANMDQIARKLEEDGDLMENSPSGELKRKETLRDLPQSLTLKRNLKAHLNHRVRSNKSMTTKSLGIIKKTKYRTNMAMSKANTNIKNTLYSLELWYNDLKIIEGHFGSGVATYFKFLRWLFFLNIAACIIAVGFISIPQALYAAYENESDVIISDNGTETKRTYASMIMNERTVPYMRNDGFEFSNIFTGEGYFVNTTLYYGFYANDTVRILAGLEYNIPYAYFFSMLFLYVSAFCILSFSMAKSYRHSFIETASGLKDVFANKIFCGWDFGIATENAAKLKSKSIFNELQELLELIETKKLPETLLRRFWLVGIRTCAHILSFGLLGGLGFGVWILLEEHNSLVGLSTLWLPIGVNAVFMVMPMFLSWLVRFEEYRSPRTALYIVLMRTFLVEVVVVGVLLSFWLTQRETNCWETSLGQEIYRLILIDFFIAVVGTALIEIFRTLISKLFPIISACEFNIPHSALGLVYNQTLFWVGLMFSPLLGVIMSVKMVFTFYIKRICLLKLCVPPAKPFRAAQTQTLFLVLTFLSLLGIVIVHGYIITKVPTSTCGPFRNHDYIYKLFVEGVLALQKDSTFWLVLISLTRPAVMAGVLVAMCVCVYYLRAKARARIAMVQLLRDMLVLEGKDKEFLINNISKVTQEDWLHHSNVNSTEGPSRNLNGLKKRVL